MKSLMRRALLTLSAASLMCATTAVSAQQVTRMKIQTAVPTASIYFDLMKRFADRVNAMSNGRIKMEVLPDGAVVSPADFIPVAEETGLIVPIGAWALQQACGQMKVWLNAGLPIKSLAVNLSAVQFRSSSIIELVDEILASSGLAALRPLLQAAP